MNVKAIVYALASAALFGLSTPAAKALLGSLHPVALAGLLYCGAGIGAALLQRTTLVGSEASLTRAQIPYLGGAIVSGGVVGPVLLMVGLAQTKAATASLLLSLEGVATALLAWYVFRESFDRRIALGMVCLVSGGLEHRALIGSIASMPEEVPAFSGIEQAASVADGAPERVVGPGACCAQMGFELGEGHLDGIEVMRNRLGEQEPGTSRPQQPRRPSRIVYLQVVKDDDVACLQGGSELCLDVDVESGPIHCAFEEPWGRQPMATQGGNEGLGVPVAEGGRTGQPLALRGPAPQPGQLGGGRCLVDEGEAVRHGTHNRLALIDPHVAELGCPAARNMDPRSASNPDPSIA